MFHCRTCKHPMLFSELKLLILATDLKTLELLLVTGIRLAKPKEIYNLYYKDCLITKQESDDWKEMVVNMWNKPWVRWLSGMAGVFVSISAIGGVTWVFAEPALNNHIKTRVAEDLKETIESLKSGQATLRAESNQTQRTLGIVESKTESTDENVKLLLRLFLEDQQRQ